MKGYPVGNMVRLRGQLKDIGGTLTDATVIKCTVKNPLGEKKTYAEPEIIKDSTGVYHLDVLADVLGSWTYRWYSSGVIKAARSNLFFVTN